MIILNVSLKFCWKSIPLKQFGGTKVEAKGENFRNKFAKGKRDI